MILRELEKDSSVGREMSWKHTCKKTRRTGEDVLRELLQHFLKKIFLLPVQVCLFQKERKKEICKGKSRETET